MLYERPSGDGKNVFQQMDDIRDEVQYVINLYYKLHEYMIKDAHFYKVALNLSGERELLEEKAKDLINKKGYFRALKESRSYYAS
jgi:hypothetical protein